MNSTGKVESVKPLSVEEALKLNKQLKSEEEKDKSESSKATANDSKDSTNTSKPSKTKGSQGEQPMVKTAKQAEQGGHTGKTGAKIHTTDKDEKDTNEKPEKDTKLVKTVLTRSQSKQTRSVNLMQKCINCFKEFFHILVSKRFIKNEKDFNTFYRQILTDQSDSDNTSVPENSFVDCHGANRSYYKLDASDCGEACLNMFTAVCNLFVEFASFPMYGQPTKMLKEQPKGKAIFPWERYCFFVYVVDLSYIYLLFHIEHKKNYTTFTPVLESPSTIILCRRTFCCKDAIFFQDDWSTST